MHTPHQSKIVVRRTIRLALRATTGAIDLASIMVGVLVLGIISAVVAATVFTVIPWSQNRAAMASLDSVRTAEDATRVLEDAYLNFAGLVAAQRISSSPSVNVAVDAAGLCFIAVSASDTGNIYHSSNLRPQALLYASGDVSGCADLPALVDTVRITPAP